VIRYGRLKKLADFIHLLKMRQSQERGGQKQASRKALSDNPSPGKGVFGSPAVQRGQKKKRGHITPGSREGAKVPRIKRGKAKSEVKRRAER